MTGEIERRDIYDESVANLLLTGLLFMIPCQNSVVRLFMLLQVQVFIKAEAGWLLFIFYVFGFKLLIGAVEKVECSCSHFNQRYSSVFHLPECGGSHVPQLLRALHLIVSFVYLAALLPVTLMVGKHTTIKPWYTPYSPSLPPLSLSSLPPSLIGFPSPPSLLWERTCEGIHRLWWCQITAMFFQITKKLN